MIVMHAYVCGTMVVLYSRSLGWGSGVRGLIRGAGTMCRHFGFAWRVERVCGVGCVVPRIRAFFAFAASGTSPVYITLSQESLWNMHCIYIEHSVSKYEYDDWAQFCNQDDSDRAMHGFHKVHNPGTMISP